MAGNRCAAPEKVPAWYNEVYEAVQEIPHGRLTTYAHIAKLIEKRELVRQFMKALNHLPSPPSPLLAVPGVAANVNKEVAPKFHSGNIPWHRVVTSSFSISPRVSGGDANQATLLGAEGVTGWKIRWGEGEYWTDLRYEGLKRRGWFPDVLPSKKRLLKENYDKGCGGEKENNECAKEKEHVEMEKGDGGEQEVQAPEAEEEDRENQKDDGGEKEVQEPEAEEEDRDMRNDGGGEKEDESHEKEEVQMKMETIIETRKRMKKIKREMKKLKRSLKKIQKSIRKTVVTTTTWKSHD